MGQGRGFWKQGFKKKSPGGLAKTDCKALTPEFLLQKMCVGLIICISNTIPGDADAADGGGGTL